MLSLSAVKTVGFGGDGGRGGSVILKVSPHIYDLKNFKGKQVLAAQPGEPGARKHKKGKDAEDLIVYVPQGTRVIEGNELIADLVELSSELLLCRGGRGGLGSFKRDYTVEPQAGQEREVVLDYRIVNDLAIVGFANSGKTTLFNALTGQKQKVADYPFTTTSCMWAPAQIGLERFMVLDTPPLSRLKRDSSQEKNSLLNQILRSKAVILLSADGLDFKEILEAIKNYDASLLQGKKIICLARDRNEEGVYLSVKIDTIDKKEKVKKLKPAALKRQLFKILGRSES